MRLAALVLVVLYAVVGCRAESARTWTQVDILRDALADGAWDHRTKSTMNVGSGFVDNIVRGAWGVAKVHQTPEEVLDNLAAGSRAAGISPPLCVTLDARKRADLTSMRPDAKYATYACEPIRHRRAFGWLLIIPYGRNEAGRPNTQVQYGLGPNAGGLRLFYRWPDG
ncbi:hypothetical protein [Cellulosimicrobium cellulans]|uniref:hypothetical protein n=1 Tax=Cellulosimicrobium cellulans TaxID=1710 RepID=UPI00130EE3C8|nr:hypothetical protein [Cellulosimicrobium cellulans]